MKRNAGTLVKLFSANLTFYEAINIGPENINLKIMLLSCNIFLFVLKKPGASHRDKTETLRRWRALLFPALREKKATRYAGGSLLNSLQMMLVIYKIGRKSTTFKYH